MRLLKPSTEIIKVTVDPLELIEIAGRVCYKSEDKITEESADVFSKMLLKLQHESVVEHASATVRFICDRGVSHEIVRHRIASYSQESTRYVNYKGGCQFIIPPWLSETIPVGEYHREQDVPVTPPANGARLWIRNRLEDEKRYNTFIGMGWRPEMARGELPNCTKTEVIMTTNFREWRHFFKLRCSKAAHPQMREISIPLLMKFKAKIPVIFDDIEVPK